jgi:leader peptidase (prepilin peptidase) / N-methyltransferase
MLSHFKFSIDVVGALIGAIVGLLWAPWSSMLISRAPILATSRTPEMGPQIRTGLPFLSTCCNRPLGIADSIPVLSALMRRGRCRQCGEPIPWFEFVNDALCVGVGAFTGLVTGQRYWLPALLWVLLVLVPISIFDLRWRLIATKLVYPSWFIALMLFGFSAARNGDWMRFRLAVICSFCSSGFMWVLHIVYPRGMGKGDARLMLMLGLGSGWFGWQGAILGLAFGFLLSNFIGIPYSLIRYRNLKAMVPFGPFLGLGAALVMWFAP